VRLIYLRLIAGQDNFTVDMGSTSASME